jgi:hypothetical protein
MQGRVQRRLQGREARHAIEKNPDLVAVVKILGPVYQEYST